MAQNDLNHKLVAIGGSAGSLSALLRILKNIHRQQLPPIILVLHRKALHDTILVDLLNIKTDLLVKEASEKELLTPGSIYIVPADYHLLIENDRTLSLDDSEKINYSRPSIDVTFESAAEVFGPGLTAILLSGANADGVEGLKNVKKRGGNILIQQPSTAEVPYMPLQAIEEIETRWVLSPEEIGEYINQL